MRLANSGVCSVFSRGGHPLRTAGEAPAIPDCRRLAVVCRHLDGGVSWAMLSSALTHLVVSWVACLMLGLTIYCCFHDSVNTVWNRATHTVAKYSYGIYLCQVPMMWLVFRVWNTRNDLLASPLSLMLTSAAAVAAYHVIEHPMIQLARRLTRARVDERSSTFSDVSPMG
jgi:peptidoglycan/LPS O-acetylase OafA/YrhL